MVRAPGRPLSDYKPEISFHDLRRYGFQAMLIDLIEAPEPMLCYFCHYNSLHQIPIADSLSPDQIERIKRDLPKLRLFFTSSTRVSWIVHVCVCVCTCVCVCVYVCVCVCVHVCVCVCISFVLQYLLKYSIYRNAVSTRSSELM